MTGASLSGRLARVPDGLLRFDAGRDLGAVVDLLEVGFHEDLDERDRRWLRDLSMLSSAGPLFGLLMSTVPKARAAFTGFVWYAEGRLVGNVSLIRRQDEVWTIANVVTHPAARRRGIGQRLMAAALDAAASRGAADVHLFVRQDNEEALALYDKLGFESRGVSTTLRRSALGGLPAWTAPASSGFAIVPWRRPDDPRARQLLRRAGESSAMGSPLRAASQRSALRQRFDDWMRIRRRVALAASSGATYRALALAVVETQPIAMHQLAFAIDPLSRGRVERPLVGALLARLDELPDAPAEASVSSQDGPLDDALRAAGFEATRALAHLAVDVG